MSGRRTDEQTERLLSDAVHRDFEAELRRIPPREELEKKLSFSPEHTERMERLFSSEPEKAPPAPVKDKRAVKYLSRAAAVFCVAMTAVFCLLLTSPLVRAGIADTYMLWTGASPQPDNSEADSVWYAQYVPEGFEPQGTLEDGPNSWVLFRSAEGRELKLMVRPASDPDTGQNSFVVYGSVEADGVRYELAFSTEAENPSNAVFWSRNGLGFALASDMPADELADIARSIDIK